MNATLDLSPLRSHPIAKGLPDELVGALAPCAEELTFEPGQLVFRQGRPADAVYLVLSGRAALEQHVPARGTLRLEELRAGDVLGFSWIHPGGEWTLDARAVEPLRTLRLDAECLQSLMAREPRIALSVCRYLNARLWERLQRVRLQRLDVYGAEG